MYNINGFDNEYEFVKYLNGKRIMELNPMFEELIKYLFPNARGDSIIKSWRNHYKQKTDVFIIPLPQNMPCLNISSYISNLAYLYI